MSDVWPTREIRSKMSLRSESPVFSGLDNPQSIGRLLGRVVRQCKSYLYRVTMVVILLTLYLKFHNVGQLPFLPNLQLPKQDRAANQQILVADQ